MSKKLLRYQRQIILPEIGEQGQKRLLQTKVLCVGAGGLGSPALLYLAAAGIGKLGIIDNDVVEISNLQRQILYSTQETNHSKALTAAKRLNDLNPDCQIATYKQTLNAQNAAAIMSQYDVVIDATDNFSSKFLINDCAVKLELPMIYAAITGFEGQISVFYAKQGPCYRCLYPESPSGYIPNCAESGVIGALAGTIGSMQALETIKMIINESSLPPLIGKLALYDARTQTIEQLKIKKNVDCPVCSLDKNSIQLIDIHSACQTIQSITVEQLKNQQKKPLFIDVREDDELRSGVIPNAIHLPLSHIENLTLKQLPINQSQEYIVYCQTGTRSQIAISMLKEKGIKRLITLQGGISAWKRQ